MAGINPCDHSKRSDFVYNHGHSVPDFVVNKPKNKADASAPHGKKPFGRDGTFPLSADYVRLALIVGGFVGIPLGAAAGYLGTRKPAAVPQPVRGEPVGTYHEIPQPGSPKPGNYPIHFPFQPRSGW
jgi:hypothetical protein